MRLFKASYSNRDGALKQSRKWYVEFRDQRETIRRLAAFTSKSASAELGRKLEQLVAYHRATAGQLDPELQQWVNDLPRSVWAKLVEIDLISGERAAATQLLSDHLEDWKQALTAKGTGKRQVDQVTQRARVVMTECRARHYADLTPQTVEACLYQLRTGEADLSPQTSNAYLAAIKQFCRWMQANGRASELPLAHLKPLNTQVDRRHDRRALTEAELEQLLTATAAGPVRHGRKRAGKLTWRMTGAERALLYRLAVETGFRANELRSLTLTSLALQADPPTVTVAAGYSKRRRQDTQPLRPDTAKLLADQFADHPADAPLFQLPRRENLARLFRQDLEAAGVPYQDAAGLFADFHALRHSFITRLAKAGVHPKTAQALARHSTITLTMDRYAHSDDAEQVAALDALPELASDAASDLASDNGDHLALCLAQAPPSRDKQGGRMRRKPTAEPDPSMRPGASVRAENKGKADRAGFEPAVRLYTARRFSKPVPSAARPPVHWNDCGDCSPSR